MFKATIFGLALVGLVGTNAYADKWADAYGRCKNIQCSPDFNSCVSSSTTLSGFAVCMSGKKPDSACSGKRMELATCVQTALSSIK
jgi:hypothetical protein